MRERLGIRLLHIIAGLDRYDPDEYGYDDEPYWFERVWHRLRRRVSRAPSPDPRQVWSAHTLVDLDVAMRPIFENMVRRRWDKEAAVGKSVKVASFADLRARGEPQVGGPL